VHQRTFWGHGVSIGLTPLGARALLGVPMRELVGSTARLADLLGHGEAELAERLAEAADWPTRFALLDAQLTARLAVPERPDTGHALYPVAHLSRLASVGRVKLPYFAVIPAAIVRNPIA
jgi:hypothetical protein